MGKLDLTKPEYFYNRELSWLKFNLRVLKEAMVKDTPLLERLKDGKVREVIIATNPSMEGDATALYLQQRILPLGIKVSRLARGLPVGGDIEYADQNTLLRALAGRQSME